MVENDSLKSQITFQSRSLLLDLSLREFEVTAMILKTLEFEIDERVIFHDGQLTEAKH